MTRLCPSSRSLRLKALGAGLLVVANAGFLSLADARSGAARGAPIVAAAAEPIVKIGDPGGEAAEPIAQAQGQAVAHPQCIGARFVRRSDDAPAAADLMAGWLRLHPRGRVRLPTNPRWNENPFRDSNWVFQYQTLRWLDVLRREGMRTGNAAMLDRYLTLIEDWVADNPYGRARSRYSWYDMSVGVRAITLVCASHVAGMLPWLRDAMTDHAEVLKDPREYRGVANHSLHQNNGLLAIGCATANLSWQGYAVDRTAKLLSRSVDTQGVTDEGSTLYQHLNYAWYSEILERMKRCAIEPEGPFDRLALMPTFLAHATRPDGTLTGIGDADPRGGAPRIAGTAAEYAATRGAHGPRPLHLFKTYWRGYAFSRSGWYERRPWWRESYATVRYGPGRTQAAHAHQDAGSVTFFALGKDVLWDQGQWGGSGGPNRRFVIDNEAHNVVDIPSATYRESRATALLARQESATHHLVKVRSTNLSGATWTRTVVHALEPGFLVVDDLVTQTSARKIVQRWYVGGDRRVALGSSRASTLGSGSNATFAWVGRTPSLTTVRGQRNPMLGWRSLRSNHIASAPVVQASATGRVVRLTTIIVPRGSGVRSGAVSVRNTVTTSTSRTFDVVVGSTVYRVRLAGNTATVRAL